MTLLMNGYCMADLCGRRPASNRSRWSRSTRGFSARAAASRCRDLLEPCNQFAMNYNDKHYYLLNVLRFRVFFAFSPHILGTPSFAKATTPAGARPRQQALSTRMPEAETSAHLESASASNRGAAASLLQCHQSKLHGSSGPKATTPAGAWPRRQALSTRVPEAETSTHIEFAPVSHRGAAASLIHQWELHGGSSANANTPKPCKPY